MSLSTKGQTCPICHSYLFDEDDIVHCPVCGAPHHRDCYNSLGHCGLEQFHGTNEQYDPSAFSNEEQQNEQNNNDAKEEKSEITVQCRSCGEKYPVSSQKCPNCGTPNFVFGGNFVAFDPLGGVPENLDIGDGVTAGEAGKFVGPSSNRLIPKFAAIKVGKKVSFNPWALIFTSAYYAFRKMYLPAIFSAIVEIAALLLIYPFMDFALPYLENSNGTFFAAQQLMGVEIPMDIFLLSVAGILLNVSIRLFNGFFVNRIYYSHTIKKINEIKDNPDKDTSSEIPKQGGVNIFLFLIFYFCTSYVAQAIWIIISGQ